jgi:peptidoglycan/xylan/chitin deacetylase (PgdA/CDA1 family)
MAREGICFGNHTATHPNITRLPLPAQRAEINRGKAALDRELGACPAFAFPFGDLDADSRRIAREAGHRCLLEVGGGNERPRLLCLGRHTPRATAEARIFADLEVVAPVVALARRIRAFIISFRKTQAPEAVQ